MKKQNMIFRLKLEITELVNEMVGKLPESLFISDSTTFLDPSMGGGQFVQAVESRLRKHGHSDSNIKNRVFGIEKSLLRVNYAVNSRKLVGSYIVDNTDVPDIFMNMKFDAIVGNPPYNAPKTLKKGSEKLGGGTTLWDKFILKSFDLLKDGGYTCFVHPIGWRSFEGDYENVAEVYKKYDLQYVKMADSQTGIKVFSAGTAFDVVITRKEKYNKKTELVGYDGEKIVVDISDWVCIPSGKFSELNKIIVGKGGSRNIVGYSRSAYGSDKNNISKKKSAKHIYPVIHSVNVFNEPTLIYSNTDKNGMFGEPKLIFGRRCCGTFLDLDGIYACSQDTRYLASTRENLPKIYKAFNNPRFIELMKYLSWNSTAQDKYDMKGISLLRKDFWKDFV